MIRITLLDGPRPALSSEGWPHTVWLLHLTSPHGSMTTTWRQAFGLLSPAHPAMTGPVLDALAAEAAPWLFTASFEEFCADLDPDDPAADPRAAYAVWAEAGELARGLHRLLGGTGPLVRACGAWA